MGIVLKASLQSRASGLAGQSIPLAGTIAIYGLMTAAQTTTLSLFLADAVHAAPFLVGLFFTVRAAAGIMVGLVAGWLSDRMPDRRVLLLVAGLSGTAGALSLALFRDYALLLATTTVFLSLGASAFGQLFAYAHELATEHGRDVTGFSSGMRSVFSAAFVLGAPLGLPVMTAYGFGPLYLGVAGLTLVSAVAGRWGLRRVPREVTPRTPGERGGAWQALRGALPARVWLLLGVVLLLGMVIQMYNIDIALHVTKDLRRSAQLVGWMMALTAGLEIPVMMVMGRAARRVGSGRLVGASAVLAAMSYCLMPLVASTAALLAVAALVGVWQGVALSIPMVMVQNESPGGVGTASSLYGATFGSAGLVAGGAAGVTASVTGYGGVLWVCAALSAVAAAGMLARRAHRFRPTPP